MSGFERETEHDNRPPASSYPSILSGPSVVASPDADGMYDSPAMIESFRLLRQAYKYARELNRCRWDFAVDIRSLRAAGMHSNDLRWLVFQGYVEHARELTRLADSQRKFGPVGTSLFTKRACFVLTEAGARFAETLHSTQRIANTSQFPSTPSTSVASPVSANANGTPVTPRWDCDLREIRFAGQLVKQFKLPSPNQEAILMTFEEEGWKCRIDDPLPPHPQCDPKQRLHDTIRSLNRNQKTKLLRFKGDGTGEGILWEPILDANGADDEE